MDPLQLFITMLAGMGLNSLPKGLKGLGEAGVSAGSLPMMPQAGGAPAMEAPQAPGIPPELAPLMALANRQQAARPRFPAARVSPIIPRVTGMERPLELR